LSTTPPQKLPPQILICALGGVGLDSGGDISLAGQYAGATFSSSDLEIAFHIAVNQLQLRASYLNANAVIAFRYDIDFDSHANVLNFMATAFGTAVRLT
ncbi:MAG TPA: heavy metal-binding domain-containing protein, partial [Verrucomicrobiota bacterium]|nr:heavy metal-binding domain-containing protein [Verrucomicrobiota bacterium]